MKWPSSLLPAPRKCLWRSDQRCGTGMWESIDPSIAHPQGYRIELDSRGAHVSAADEAGLFYARQTPAQLRRAHGNEIPQGAIEDWPDFAVRGVMLDISRDKVPTMATLFTL